MTLRVRIDQFCRISLPKKIRDRLKIRGVTPLEILVDGNSIILKKNNSTCVVTGEASNPKMKTSNGMKLSLKGAKILLEDLLKLYHKGDI